MSDSGAREEPLLHHLRELRRRIVICALSILVVFAATAFYAKDLFALLSWPLQQVLPKNSHFITTHPIEAWYVYFKTALFAALFLDVPIVFWQFWKFVAPGLYARERKVSLAFAALSSLFFLAGAAFGYYVAFPTGFGYFASVLGGTDILFLPRMSDYLGFACHLLLAFGIIFETPLLVFFLAASGVVSVAALIRFQRYYIVAAFVIAAVLTPPDAVSQIIMGLPLILLYELGLAAAWLRERLRGRDKTASAA